MGSDNGEAVKKKSYGSEPESFDTIMNVERRNYFFQYLRGYTRGL